MKDTLKSPIISTGLAIFSMLFGAGNLMYPIAVGLQSGNLNFFGMLGFLITGVLLPVIGLTGMILFDGNYKHYFCRIGALPGSILIAACMAVIGPVIAIPRIVTVSRTMIEPFLFFQVSPLVFTLAFLGITFLATFRENKIVSLLGNVISPALLASLAIIIFKGIYTAQEALVTQETPLHLFLHNLRRGYGTLDLLGGIFFSSIVLTLLKQSLPGEGQKSLHRLAIIGLKASFIGTMLLGLVYIGMSWLGVYHGHHITATLDDALFRDISFEVLGRSGQFVIAIAVSMACFSTAIALAAVLANYVQEDIFQHRISFLTSLIVVLASCIPLSISGLETIAGLAGGPITYVGYPTIIMLTFCNIAYKLFGFQPVKVPVALTFIVTLVLYCLNG